jgi:hypothetical protein
VSAERPAAQRATRATRAAAAASRAAAHEPTTADSSQPSTQDLRSQGDSEDELQGGDTDFLAATGSSDSEPDAERPQPGRLEAVAARLRAPAGTPAARRAAARAAAAARAGTAPAGQRLAGSAAAAAAAAAPAVAAAAFDTLADSDDDLDSEGMLDALAAGITAALAGNGAADGSHAPAGSRPAAAASTSGRQGAAAEAKWQPDTGLQPLLPGLVPTSHQQQQQGAKGRHISSATRALTQVRARRMQACLLPAGPACVARLTLHDLEQRAPGAGGTPASLLATATQAWWSRQAARIMPLLGALFTRAGAGQGAGAGQAAGGPAPRPADAQPAGQAGGARHGW